MYCHNSTEFRKIQILNGRTKLRVLLYAALQKDSQSIFNFSYYNTS